MTEYRNPEICFKPEGNEVHFVAEPIPGDASRYRMSVHVNGKLWRVGTSIPNDTPAEFITHYKQKFPKIKVTFTDRTVPIPDELAAIDTLLEETRKLIHERDALRTALIAVGRSVGCFLSDKVTTKFITEGVPGEVEALLRDTRSNYKVREFARGYRQGVTDSAEVCDNAALLAETVIETNCSSEAQLFRVRAKEILNLLDKIPAVPQ